MCKEFYFTNERIKAIFENSGYNIVPVKVEPILNEGTQIKLGIFLDEEKEKTDECSLQ